MLSQTSQVPILLKKEESKKPSEGFMTQPSQTQHTTVPLKQLSKVQLSYQDSDFSKHHESFLNRGVNYNANLLTWLDCLNLTSSISDGIKAVRDQIYKVQINDVEG